MLVGWGNDGEGSLEIRDSGSLTANAAGIGTAHASSGSVIVSGRDSLLELDSFLSIGSQGQGTLRIENQGNFGGLLEFERDFTNSSNGFVRGRGQFIAGGGFTNEGVMAFSGGTTDILGDVVNSRGGRIVTSGLGLTTFFDDQLDIAGDFYLDGELLVSLFDGFELGANQEFLIADVGGELFGQFDGLEEGGLLGTFSNQSLFISNRLSFCGDWIGVAKKAERNGCITESSIVNRLINREGHGLGSMPFSDATVFLVGIAKLQTYRQGILHFFTSKSELLPVQLQVH